jgi:uncharacterized protein with PIN domain
MVATVTLRVYGELRYFVDGDRGGHIDLPIGAPRSVKDVVESAGIPHPEIALLLVDGTSVDFSHLIRGGERVAVYPPFHTIDIAATSLVEPPPPQPRFVCDVHLGRLVRRLRLLGFDTWYRTDTDDDELVDVATTQQRILLTRDRGLLMRRAIIHGYCPRSDHADAQAGEVLRRFRLVEAVRPMSRCARCNGLLVSVDKAKVLDLLPPRTRVEHHQFARCRECGHVYWPGSHTSHIARFVDAARDAAQRPPTHDWTAW